MSVQRQAIPCPECGTLNDGFSDPTDEDNAPSDGDMSICLYCGAWTVFIVDDGVLSQRKCTDAEVEILRKDSRNARMEEFVKLAIEGRW